MVPMNDKEYMDDRIAALLTSNSAVLVEIKNLKNSVEKLGMALEKNYVRKEQFDSLKAMLFVYITLSSSVIGWIAKTIYDMNKS